MAGASIVYRGRGRAEPFRLGRLGSFGWTAGWGGFEAPTAPVVSIHPDSWCVVNGTFGRVAVETDTGDPITAREWKIISGPVDAGNVVGTDVVNIWAPTATGSYVIRYTATNGIGASYDEISLEVGGVVEGPQNSITNVSRR